MLVRRYRIIVQHLSFVILMYGGRFGIQLGPAVPCFACPYVSGCGGQCYLMGLQGYIGFGLTLNELMGYQGLRALAYFLLFAFLVVMLGKLWCGFVCPFGLFQDWITWLRRKLGFPEGKFSPETLKALGPIKYILLGWLMVGPVLINLGLLHSDFYLPFCSICPGKPILPLFALETQYFAIDSTNTATLVITTLSVLIAGGTLAGIFARPRFFCTFCPLLALIHLFKPITLPHLLKDPALCHGCGTCQRGCPMDVRKIFKDGGDPDVQVSDCINCGECLGSCAAGGALCYKYAGKTLLASSPGLALGKGKAHRHGGIR
ncbi:MAG: 4Fe-4S binding protein [Deltaproteobacteria bacterium]|jgi:polyferredoxin|nr:4Fe-4S binding protein [Deltaproteobacteria bacterium]